jgi:sugar phosphate isomerase/epimerase
MATVAGIGYAGFETQLGVLPLDDPAAFREASSRAGGIAVCGAHTGGRWGDADGAPDIPALVERAARLPDLGCRTLVVSMGLAPDAPGRDVERAVARLGQLGRACREAGVTVAFHNHGRELEGDARILRAIVDGCPPEAVSLGADLGWVAHAGWDVADFLATFGDRVAYLHVRDVTGDGDGAGFTEVGRGRLDHPLIFRMLADAGYTGWVVAESELGERWHGSTDPTATARLQIAGIRALVRMRDGDGATTCRGA